VRDALATLPWVETSTIDANRDLRQVKFTVKDKSQFDLEACKKVIATAGYDYTKLLVGPTEK
jgi:type IV secretory pathway component VirB8